MGMEVQIRADGLLGGALKELAQRSDDDFVDAVAPEVSL